MQKSGSISIKKSHLLALNKIDALDEKEVKKKIKLLQKKIDKNKKIFTISAVTGQGTKDVLRALYDNIESYREEMNHG